MSVKLGTVGVVVKDMKKSLEFYRLLGLPIAAEADADDNLDVELPGGIVLGFLAEATARQADPTYVTPQGASLNLQFQCASASEVDSLFAQLTGHGYPAHAEPWDAPWGQRFARVVDPDGRIVNLYASL